MATYLILNLVVSAVVFVGLVFLKILAWNRAIWVTLGLLLLATAASDSIIIAAGIVAYNPERILGLFVGRAPVEDFFYSLVVAILVPGLWKLSEGGKSTDTQDII